MKEKKEFNFAKRWVKGLATESENASKLNNKILALGIGSVLCLGALGSTPWLWEYKLSRDIIVVEDQISDLRDIANQVNQLKALKAKSAAQQELQTIMQNSSHDPAPILAKLKNILPAGALVNSFALQENTLTLSVNVPTPVDVARLWISLRDSGMFQEVDIQTVSLQDAAQTMNFDLRLK